MALPKIANIDQATWLRMQAQNAVPQVDGQPQPNDFVTPPAAPLAPGQSTSNSVKVSQSYLSPESEARRKELQGLVDRFQQKRLTEEQAGIDQYQKAALDYQAAPLNYDLTPLAALLDQWSGGGNLMAAAQAMKGLSPAEKQKELMSLKKELQGMKGNLTKSQFDMYKSQLDVLNDESKTIAAERRFDQKMREAEERASGTQGRADDRSLQTLQSRMADFQDTDGALKNVEQVLGFNAKEFDSASSTVRGKRVDLPGVTIPILGKMQDATPEGRHFKSALYALTNITLKDRSGAAVTPPESQRLLKEFALDRFRFGTEADFLNALKDFTTRLQANQQQVLRGFKPEVVNRYLNPDEVITNYERVGGAAPSVTSGNNSEAQKKLDENRAKQEKLKRDLGL